MVYTPLDGAHELLSTLSGIIDVWPGADIACTNSADAGLQRNQTSVIIFNGRAAMNDCRGHELQNYSNVDTEKKNGVA